MALLEYRCKHCGLEELAFDTDRQIILPSETGGCRHCWTALQPLARVVHSSELFMVKLLDSIRSTAALCDKITREAREQYELKAYQNMKREL